jgi:hypothetical protein
MDLVVDGVIAVLVHDDVDFARSGRQYAALQIAPDETIDASFETPFFLPHYHESQQQQLDWDKPRCWVKYRNYWGGGIYRICSTCAWTRTGPGFGCGGEGG